MPLNNAALDIGAIAMRDAMAFLSLHTADPSTNGANPALSPRVASGWTGPTANGDLVTTNRAFSGGTPSGTVHSVGFWSTAGTGLPPTGGTFYGSQTLTGDPNFNSAGEYTITNLQVNGSSP
jgi:hypothetical protein